MKHISRIVVIALVSICCWQNLFSQTLALPGDGKDFWVGYMFPSYNKVAHPATEGFYGAYLLISSYTNNHVLIHYFDPTSGVEYVARNVNLSARTGTQVPIDISSVIMADSS